MNIKILIILFICIFFAFQTISAQVQQDPSHPLPDYVRRNEERRGQFNEINGIGSNGMILKRDSKVVSRPRRPVYEGEESETLILMETFERTKGMLEIPNTYYEQYKNLLVNKKVGMARLQPERDCFTNFTVTVEELERCADVVPIPGGGSFYSFRSVLNYPSEATVTRIVNKSAVESKIPLIYTDNVFDWWNIHLQNEKFDVSNKSIHGIISDIGDVPFENLDLKSTEFEFLNDYKPKRNEAEVKQQKEVLKKGVKFNNFTYSNTIPVKLNSTYVLRSIDYRSKLDPNLKFDKDADMRIVFKVIGRENDGSVIIIWKKLKTTWLKTEK